MSREQVEVVRRCIGEREWVGRERVLFMMGCEIFFGGRGRPGGQEDSLPKRGFFFERLAWRIELLSGKGGHY